MRVLFVCLGNICRSPLAEGILKTKINKLLPGGYHYIASAGFEAFHTGDRADKRSVNVATRYGIDITSHRARLFETADFDRFDKIYVMDHDNYKDVMEMCRNSADKNKTDYIMNLINPGANLPVPDPWYGSAGEFEQVYQLLDKATDKLMEILK